MKLLDQLFILDEITETENGFEAVLKTNPEHLIYSAHFPGNPITPGVCIIQIANELLEKQLGKRLYLNIIKNVKFLSVIIPAEGKKIKYAFSGIAETETGCKTQVVVSDETMVYAKMSLIFGYEPV